MAMGQKIPSAAECIVWRSSEEEVLLARLLDDVRQEIVEAWDRGIVPRYLLVEEPARKELMHSKAQEIERGNTLLVLGLIVLGEADLDAAADAYYASP